MAKNWYVVHTQTGHEDRIKIHLENRIKAANAQELITQVLIPTEKVSEVRSGKKKIMERKFFPGYVLIEMELSSETQYFINNVPSVTSFVGPSRKPEQLKQSEVDRILGQISSSKIHEVPSMKFNSMLSR